MGFQHRSTVQSFEHGKTPVVTAVFGVLATLGFWFRWAADIRTTSGPPHLFRRFPYSSSGGTKSNLTRSSHKGDQTPEGCTPQGSFFDFLPLDRERDTREMVLHLFCTSAFEDLKTTGMTVFFN